MVNRYSQLNFEEIWLPHQNSIYPRAAGSTFLCSFLWGGTTIEQEPSHSGCQHSQISRPGIHNYWIHVTPIPWTTWDSTGRFRIHSNTTAWKKVRYNTMYKEHTLSDRVQSWQQVDYSNKNKNVFILQCLLQFCLRKICQQISVPSVTVAALQTYSTVWEVEREHKQPRI